MSQSASVSASFLNLDMELQASSDLAPFAESLGQEVFVLFCGETEGGYRLSVEPVINGALNGNPAACTEYFVSLLEGLSQDQKNIWDSCRSRMFDYGFDGGLEENPLHTDICLEHLTRMARLGIEVRITIYPFRGNKPENDVGANDDRRV
jgi:hypothetical protein